MGILYLVATPIGNLEDISLRAITVLGKVGLIAAEDTRKTRILLNRYDIATPLTSYYEHNKVSKLDYLINTLRDKDIALVSDAGMPGISDPGYELVRAAIGEGITIVPIPGPSAVVTALAVSGLPTDQFTFIGFLPRRSAERKKRMKALSSEPKTILAYEAPHRLVATLRDINDVLGNRQICLARELTKLHEEVLRGSVQEMLTHFSSTPPRGEFTIVIAGAAEEARPPVSEEEILERLNILLDSGFSGREAVRKVAEETGHPKKLVYSLFTKNINKEQGPS